MQSDQLCVVSFGLDVHLVWMYTNLVPGCSMAARQMSKNIRVWICHKVSVSAAAMNADAAAAQMDAQFVS